MPDHAGGPRPSEDEVIARLLAPLATHPGADGLRDDAALLSPAPGTSLVVTTDALVQGVHFLDDPPATIARKALRVNLSDLAAKGAEPHAFLLALALPEGWTAAWLEEFVAGLAADAAAYRFPLLGGDTVRTPGPLTLAVTAFGLVPGSAIPRRSGARPGDRLYVSGTIGDGALGLLARREDPRLRVDAEERRALVARYQVPEPRVALAPAVRAHASAAMDVSDGLAGDAAKLLRASGTTATLSLDAVPLSGAVRSAVAADPALRDLALTGGDDYEILCAVPFARAAAFEADAARAGVPVTAIGTVEAGQGPPAWIDSAGRPHAFPAAGFSHF